jgi:hypothetical protein
MYTNLILSKEKYQIGFFDSFAIYPCTTKPLNACDTKRVPRLSRSSSLELGGEQINQYLVFRLLEPKFTISALKYHIFKSQNLHDWDSVSSIDPIKPLVYIEASNLQLQGLKQISTYCIDLFINEEWRCLQISFYFRSCTCQIYRAR